MAAVEMIYLLAAILWIGVVLAALGLGLRFLVKWRAKRRRMNRILGLVNLPVLLSALPVVGTRPGTRWNVTQLVSIVLAEVRGGSRAKIGSPSRRPQRRARRGF